MLNDEWLLHQHQAENIHNKPILNREKSHAALTNQPTTQLGSENYDHNQQKENKNENTTEKPKDCIELVFVSVFECVVGYGSAN